MSELAKYYEMMLLAGAGKASLQEDMPVIEFIAALNKSDPLEQAEAAQRYIFNNFEIEVPTFEDEGSGFQATVYKHKETGEITIAFGQLEVIIRLISIVAKL